MEPVKCVTRPDQTSRRDPLHPSALLPQGDRLHQILLGGGLTIPQEGRLRHFQQRLPRHPLRGLLCLRWRRHPQRHPQVAQVLHCTHGVPEPRDWLHEDVEDGSDVCCGKVPRKRVTVSQVAKALRPLSFFSQRHLPSMGPLFLCFKEQLPTTVLPPEFLFPTKPHKQCIKLFLSRSSFSR